MTHPLWLCLSLTVHAGLPGVVNAEKADRLPKLARERLLKNDFAVIEGHEENFFSLYDANAYQKVPSFISTDVVLHVFHTRFDDELKKVETEVALPALRAFATAQRERAVALKLDRAARYHAVALALLSDQSPSDSELVKALREATGTTRSDLCDGALDASLFKARGHYADWRLQGYFRALTWYERCERALDGPGFADAVELVRLLDEPAQVSLAQVERLQSLVAGTSGSSKLKHWRPLLVATPAPPTALSAAQLKALRETVKPGERFALMPASDATEGGWFEAIGRTLTRLPSALDVFASMGSVAASEELGLSEAGAQEARRLWHPVEGLSARWLEVLRLLLEPPAAGQPAYARSPPWARRTLVTAAGSYAELKHDTLLYVRQPMVMMEGGHEAELPASKVGGYVDPRPGVYRALLDLDQLLLALDPRRTPAEPDELGGFLTFLMEVSRLELSGKPLPPAFDERLRTVGSELEHLSRIHGDESPPQALVADVFTRAWPDKPAEVLHVAVGEVDELWVVAPRGGKRVLMRGGVFSYYEFSRADRLDDRGWFELLERAPPARPAWAQPDVPVSRKPRLRE